MAVQQRALAERLQRQRVGAELAHHEFLEQQRARGEPARLIGFHQSRNFVAETEDAAWFKPDHRHTAGDEGRERGDGALGFFARLVDQADREKRAPAAERPGRSVNWMRQMHPAAGSAQHSECGLNILRLEIAVEGVGEQHDFGPASSFPMRRPLRLPSPRGAKRSGGEGSRGGGHLRKTNLSATPATSAVR